MSYSRELLKILKLRIIRNFMKISKSDINAFDLINLVYIKRLMLSNHNLVLVLPDNTRSGSSYFIMRSRFILAFTVSKII